MSHAIEQVNGKYAMAYAGEVPWHGLGTQVSPDLTPDEMLKAAGLEWEVRARPMFVEVDGARIDVGRKALVRDSDNKVLTVISDDWKPVQNNEAFEFFDDFIKAGDMEMHTAGSLQGGQIIWALAKVKESFSLFRGDTVQSYLLFSNPHIYGRSVDIRFSPVRVVCWNTLQLSLAGKGDLQVRIDHRHKFDPDFAKETLGIATKKLSRYKEMAQFLGSKKYTDETVSEYFKRVFPSTANKKDLSRPAKEASVALVKQPGTKYAPGTWWQAYNASTFVVDHILGHKADTRINSAWYGVNRQRKIVALEKAIEFAEAA